MSVDAPKITRIVMADSSQQGYVVHAVGDFEHVMGELEHTTNGFARGCANAARDGMGRYHEAGPLAVNARQVLSVHPQETNGA
jgi:hypothetical protein